MHSQPEFKFFESLPPIRSSDFSVFFMTDTVFRSRKKAIDWAKSIAIANNFCIKIGRTKTTKTWLPCDKEGWYTPRKDKNDRAYTKSKKCGCPFMLTCKEDPKGSWRIKVVEGKHNHIIGDNVHDIALAGRPTPEEKAKIKEMTLNHCRPLEIAGTLNKIPGNSTNKKQIYNMMYKVRHDQMEGRTVVQDFFFQCKQHGYYLEHRTDINKKRVTHTFFSSP